MTAFKLRFLPEEVQAHAARYKVPREEELLLEELKPPTRAAGFLTKPDLMRLGCWKAPRIRPYLDRNKPAVVSEITRFALSSPIEEVRIRVLQSLDGVGWPMASVILHFCHPDPYPILDYRALWSLSVEVPKQYDFPFWWEYTQCCRGLARKGNLCMRVLDRALWQYSKESQTATRTRVHR